MLRNIHGVNRLTQTHFDLTALVGSRICHDLISPIGAISNGLELIELTGEQRAPELALVSDSVVNANARIRFFRIAYGHADPRQVVGRNDIRDILQGLSGGGRIAYHWRVEDDLPRPDVKLAFLLIQCLEPTLPYGGEIVVQQAADRLKLTATGREVRLDTGLWDIARGRDSQSPIAPATVQYALVPIEIEATGRQFDMVVGTSAVTVTT